MKRGSWIISQTWENLFFLNFITSYEVLRKIVPQYLKLDDFQGNYFTSIVPFQMSDVSFPFTPSLPFSRLNELNLRTYVTYENVPGIYFFTLDSNHRIANFIARNFFHLPYRYSKMHLRKNESFYRFESNRVELSFKIGQSRVKNDRDKFITDRYFLFTQGKKFVLRGQVLHEPWVLHDVEELDYVESLNDEFGVKDYVYSDSFYSPGFDVYFKPFKEVGTIGI